MIGYGVLYPFCLEDMEGGLDYGKQKCAITVSPAWQEHSAVFSACHVLFHTVYNEPAAGDRVRYALASAFFASGRAMVCH